MLILAIFAAFPSLKQAAFNGLALAVIQPEKCEDGTIIIKVKSEGLQEGMVKIISEQKPSN